jgi:hypothetical protein
MNSQGVIYSLNTKKQTFANVTKNPESKNNRGVIENRVNPRTQKYFINLFVLNSCINTI